MNKRKLLVYASLVSTLLFLACETQDVPTEIEAQPEKRRVLSNDFPLFSESGTLFDMYSNLGIGMYDFRALEDGFSIYIRTETSHALSQEGEAIVFSPFEGYFEGLTTTYKGDYLLGVDEKMRYFIVVQRDDDEYILSIMDDGIYTEVHNSDTAAVILFEELKPFIRAQVRLIQ